MWTSQIERKMLTRLPGCPVERFVDDFHHVAVRRRDDGAWLRRNFALRVAEKIENEKPKENQNPGSHLQPGTKHSSPAKIGGSPNLYASLTI